MNSYLNNLSHFLRVAPASCTAESPVLRCALPDGEMIHCVYWHGSHFITGTDIVKCVVFRMQQSGRSIQSLKKLEQGIFSDLRSLKLGEQCRLEEARSPFLVFLREHNCIRTQKKQKVFEWSSVNHDLLLQDALVRETQRERRSSDNSSSTISSPPTLQFESPIMTPFTPNSFVSGSHVPQNNTSSSPPFFNSPGYAQSPVFEPNGQSPMPLPLPPIVTAGLLPAENHIAEFTPNTNALLQGIFQSSQTPLEIRSSPLLTPSTQLSFNTQSYQEMPFNNQSYQEMPFNTQLQHEMSFNTQSHMPTPEDEFPSMASHDLLDNYFHSPPAKRIRMQDSPTADQFANYAFPPMQHEQSALLVSPESSDGSNTVYTCSMCPKTFSRLTHLKRHENQHSVVKRYQCETPGCNKQFSRRDHFVSHAKNCFVKIVRKRFAEPRAHLSPIMKQFIRSPLYQNDSLPVNEDEKTKADEEISKSPVQEIAQANFSLLEKLNSAPIGISPKSRTFETDQIFSLPLLETKLF